MLKKPKVKKERPVQEIASYKLPQTSLSSAKSLRLAKQARGTLEKVIALIEADTYCPETIQQVDSAIGLLRTVKKEILAEHLNACIFECIKEDKTNKIEELIKIYNLSN